MFKEKKENIAVFIKKAGNMPTIRISDEHLTRLEALAVKKTAKEQKIVTIAQALAETLEENLPKIKKK